MNETVSKLCKKICKKGSESKEHLEDRIIESEENAMRIVAKLKPNMPLRALLKRNQAKKRTREQELTYDSASYPVNGISE